MNTRTLLALLLAMLLVPLTAAAQGPPPIGFVDYYGLRIMSADRLTVALHLGPGDAVPDDRNAVVRRLRDVPGVADARVTYLCCEEGRSIVYVGIRCRSTDRCG